ncbi:MAG: hypothetical protein VST67_05485 [Nitrospirota bacterium]|nr:hypothetical protein [Nitrospirota bacterium]
MKRNVRNHHGYRSKFSCSWDRRVRRRLVFLPKTVQQTFRPSQPHTIHKTEDPRVNCNGLLGMILSSNANIMHKMIVIAEICYSYHILN